MNWLNIWEAEIYEEVEKELSINQGASNFAYFRTRLREKI